MNTMKNWPLLVATVVLAGIIAVACNKSNDMPCTPSTGCVLVEEGTNARWNPDSWKKGKCLSQTDEDWIVTYDADDDMWRSADISTIRVWSDEKPARAKIGGKIQVNEPRSPTVELCLSGRLTEGEVKSVWIWLKTTSAPPSTATIPKPTSRAVDQSDPQKVMVSFVEALVAGDCTMAAVYMDPTQRGTLERRFCQSGSGLQILSVRIDGIRQEMSFVAQQDIVFMGEIKARVIYGGQTSQEETYSLGRASMSQWNGKWYVWQLIFQGSM